VEISGALQTIKSQPGRYAITALPCQAKALRLACRFDSVLRQRITYIVGLTCGQLKTRRFVDFAARLADVPGPVAHMSFRKKNAGRSAGQFSYAFEDVEGNTAELPFPGLHWNRRWFTPAACNVCDDMFAELADVSIMDAWLPEYVEDWRGTSIAVVRHAELHELLLRGAAEGHLSIAPIAAERVVASQSGAIRYKRAPLRWKVDKETARRFAGEKRHRPAGVRDWILLEPLRLRLLRAGQERSKRRFAECAGLSKEQMLKVLNGPERILLAMLARYTWWVQRAVRLMEIIWGKCRKRPAG
jgi:coenzyme F420-reducing hydrogenase beta subunit